MRRKANAEERHARQKKKMEQAGEVQTQVYVAPPNPKQVASEKATAKGYANVLTRDNVLMFSDTDKAEEIKEWLTREFGREEVVNNPFESGTKHVTRIPFSYGFCRRIEKQTSFEQSPVLTADE